MGNASVVISIVIAGIGVVIAVIGVVIAVLTHRATVASNRIAQISIRNAMIDQFRSWANDAIDAMAQVEILRVRSATAPTADETLAMHARLRSEVSSLIDRGRMFIPNTIKDEHGQDKEPAYKGYRNRVLDLLIVFLELLREVGSNESSGFTEAHSAAFVSIRRAFVSFAFEVVAYDSVPEDPRAYYKFLRDRPVIPLPSTIDALRPDCKSQTDLVFL